MPMPLIDHYSGWEGQTCSYTTDFITKHADKFKAAGLTEADYRKGMAQSHLGFLSNQYFDVGFKDGQVLFRGTQVSTKTEATFIWDAKSKKVIQRMKGQGDYGFVEVKFDFKALHGYTSGGDWDMRVPTHRKPAVQSTSDSIGAMTDEDVATMFVKTKDAFAKEKGINIKGANPQLDLEVYESIAKQTGYSANEVRLKIEAYKASGKKLSALKKKTLGKNPVTVKHDPIDPPKKVDVNDGQFVPWVEDVKPVKSGLKYEKKTFGYDEGLEVTMDGHKVAKIQKGTQPVSAPGSSYSYATENVWKVSVYDKQGNWVQTLSYKTQKQAKDYAEKWADLKFKNLTPKVDPPPVHTAPSAPAVKDAVEDLVAKDEKHTLLYKDEDVVKAYIKAKDQLSADVSNPFTLYTKSDDFDKQIFHLMSKEYGVDLTGPEIKKHIADYLGGGNKVSVLKKKMIKNGELQPEAPTLKKTKADKQFDTAPTNSLKEAQDQIDAFAKSASDPVGSTGYKFTGGNEGEIFDGLKNQIFAKMDPSSAWERFEEMAVKYRKISGNDDISALDIIRVYDKRKAASLGIENGQFYEKIVAEWASTPAGKSHIIQSKGKIEAQAKIKAEQLKAAEAKKVKEEALLKTINEGVPSLPADSDQFQIVDMGWAHRQQKAADPWNAAQKQGLKHYTGGSYTPMNQYLRKQTSYVSQTDRKAINDAQAGMRPTTEPFLVRRGAGYQSFGIGTEGKYGFDATDHTKFKEMVGKTVEEQGFLSTSVGGEGAFGGSVKIEVEVTPGTYGAYVDASSSTARDHITLHRGEREFIIAHGTKYQILRVEASMGYGGQPGQTVIRLRTIPGSHSKAFH